VQEKLNGISCSLFVSGKRSRTENIPADDLGDNPLPVPGFPCAKCLGCPFHWTSCLEKNQGKKPSSVTDEFVGDETRTKRVINLVTQEYTAELNLTPQLCESVSELWSA
jgi:hypothetical protein